MKKEIVLQRGKVNDKGNKGGKHMEDRRVNVKDRRITNGALVVIKEAILSNLKFFITIVIIATGAWYTLGSQVQDNTKNVSKNGNILDKVSERVVLVEKNAIELKATDQITMQKLDGIDSSIKDLKMYVEKMDARNQKEFDEIKKLVYKPAIGSKFISDDNEMVRIVEGLIRK